MDEDQNTPAPAPGPGTEPEPLGGDFGSLLTDVDALEGAHQLKAEERQAAQAANAVEQAAGELLGALQMVRTMASPLMAWWPEFGQVWNDDALGAIAASGAEIMHRHGWTLGEAWGQFGPYIALIGAALPPSLVTWQAVQQRRADARRTPQQRQQQAEP
jgi:hypothetical protein